MRPAKARGAHAGAQEGEFSIADMQKQMSSTTTASSTQRGDGGDTLPSFAVGDAVEARYCGGPRHYPGVVDAINGNGTYAIAYDDGEREEEVEAHLVRAKGSGNPRVGVGAGACGTWRLRSLLSALARAARSDALLTLIPTQAR